MFSLNILEYAQFKELQKNWYKKVLLFVVDAAIINAKIICDIRYGKETTTLQFKERIIKYIFEKY